MLFLGRGRNKIYDLIGKCIGTDWGGKRVEVRGGREPWDAGGGRLALVTGLVLK